MKTLIKKWLNKTNDNKSYLEKLVKVKTEKEIIDEIHETFYTEVDRLLEFAGILKSEETQSKNLIDKSSQLRELGFDNTKECKEAQIEINRLFEIKKFNHEKKELNEVITYFSNKYPLNKFITEESVIKICNKYNLVYGPVDRYLGTVPDKNLQQMKNFKNKVSNEDCIWLHKDSWNRWSKNNFFYKQVLEKALQEEEVKINKKFQLTIS